MSSFRYARFCVSTLVKSLSAAREGAKEGMKLGELLDSIIFVNHERRESGALVLHVHLWGDGPFRDFEVEQFLIGNDGGGMITAHGEKGKRVRG